MNYKTSEQVYFRPVITSTILLLKPNTPENGFLFFRFELLKKNNDTLIRYMRIKEVDTPRLFSSFLTYHYKSRNPVTNAKIIRRHLFKNKIKWYIALLINS